MYPEPKDVYPEGPPPPPDPPERHRPHSPTRFRNPARALPTVAAALVLASFGILVLANLAGRIRTGDMTLNDWLLGAPISLLIALIVIFGALQLVRRSVTKPGRGTGTKAATGTTPSPDDRGPIA